MRIGIIGASSQVGSSVAYFLHQFGDMEVTCFIRSPRSRIFFELLGLPVESVDLQDPAALSEALRNCDVVLDFAYPTGQLFAIKRQLVENTERIVSAIRRGASYIGMSSIMAFGMPAADKYVGDHVFSRTSYARLKRVAEKVALRAGAKHGVSVYIFRLGQVHGFLQSVSLLFRENLVKRAVFFGGGSREDQTNTIFPSTIAAAVARCARHEVLPGNYTLVSNPQWSLGALYDYYLDSYGGEASLAYAPHGATRAGASKSRSLVGRMLQVAKAQRYWLDAYVLLESPSLATQLKGRYRQVDLANQVAAVHIGNRADVHLLGRPPRIFPASGSDIASVAIAERQFESRYNDAVLRARS